MKSLYALSKVANKTMSLTLPDGRKFSVIFDRANGSGVETRQLMPFAYPDDLYLITLRLIMV